MAMVTTMSLIRSGTWIERAARGAGQHEWGQHTTVLRGLRWLASLRKGGSATNVWKTYLRPTRLLFFFFVPPAAKATTPHIKKK